MGLSCTFGYHNWDGCKCTKCGKTKEHDWSKDCEKCSSCGETRENAHKWSGCKCSVCGKIRKEGHFWHGCKCSECGTVRDEWHDWSKDCERCTQCGKPRDGGHDWSKDCERCVLCGSTRENAHQWDGCKCTKCGKTRNEGHDWSKDCEKCSKCGKTRENAHDWSKDCEKCSKCGKPRDEGHDWSKDCEKCTRCGKTRENAHDWSKDCEKCSKCGATRQNAHNWDGCKCAKCGKTRDEGHNRSKDCERCSTCGIVWVNSHQYAHQWDGCKCTKCGKTRDERHDWSNDSSQCARCGQTRPIPSARDVVERDLAPGIKEISFASDDAMSGYFDQLKNKAEARDLVNEGFRLLQAGDLSGAEGKFKEAIAKNPSNAVAHGNIGCVYFRRGQHRNAIPWFEKALAIDPHVEGIPDLLKQCRDSSQPSKASMIRAFVAFGTSHKILLASFRQRIKDKDVLFCGVEEARTIDDFIDNDARFKMAALMTEVRPPASIAHSQTRSQSWFKDLLCSVPDPDTKNIDVHMDIETGAMFVTFYWDAVTGLAIRTVARGMEKAVRMAGGNL